MWEDRPGVTFGRQDLAELREIDEHWTAERLKAATPIGTPEVTQAELDQLTKPVDRDQDQGPPNLLRSSDSGQGAAPFQPDKDSRPYWNCGKLFFDNDKGEPYVGSASFVGNDNILLTAAHCLANGSTGGLYRNFLFYRAAYYDASGSLGGQRVAINWQYFWTAFFGDGQPNYVLDYGFMHTVDSSGAGYLGMGFDIPYPTSTAVGYPKNYGENKVMYASTGAIGRGRDVAVMPEMPMREGDSGGPWIGNLDPNRAGDTNLAMSLSSFHVDGQPGEHGPLFDQKTYELYVWTLDPKRAGLAVPAPA
jgi:hypothetical protein